MPSCTLDSGQVQSSQPVHESTRIKAGQTKLVPTTSVSEEGNAFLEVKCGSMTGSLFVSKVRSSEHGPNSLGKTVCILSDPDEKGGRMWYSFAKFQEAGGRMSAKNWKRSITHQGQGLYRYWDWLTSEDSTQDNGSAVDILNSDPGSPGMDDQRLSFLVDTVLERIQSTIRGLIAEFVNGEVRILKKELEDTRKQVTQLSKRLEEVEKKEEGIASSVMAAKQVNTDSHTLSAKVSNLEDAISNQQKSLELQQRSL